MGGRTQMTITLLKHDIDWCTFKSGQTLSRFDDMRGHYSNTSNSHLIGKLGEVAVDRWLTQELGSCNPHYKNDQELSLADISYGKIRFEVKTWSRVFWPGYGRCVAKAQWPDVQKKADAIIWCVETELTPESATIDIRGWNYLKDFNGTKAQVMGFSRKVENYQLPEEKLRKPEDLLDRLRLVHN